MRSHRTLLLLVVVALTGCRSNAGGGWALWNPFASPSNETAVASTEPKLPSQQFALADKSAAPTAKTSTATAAKSSAPAYTPPAAIARAAAAAPITNSATTPSGAPSYNSPIGITAKPAMPASNSLASSATSASINPSGPYDPNGYKPTVNAPVESPVSVDRYGSAGRYDTTASTAAPTTPIAMPPAESTPTYPRSGDRYATYESAATSPAPTTTAPAATTPTPVAATPVTPAPASTSPAPTTDTNTVSPASATVNITAPAGQYRPGGTTSYPLHAAQVNVASLPEKPATTAPATTTETTTPGGYPSTGAPEPSSIYGVPTPSYR